MCRVVFEFSFRSRCRHAVTRICLTLVLSLLCLCLSYKTGEQCGCLRVWVWGGETLYIWRVSCSVRTTYLKTVDELGRNDTHRVYFFSFCECLTYAEISGCELSDNIWMYFKPSPTDSSRTWIPGSRITGLQVLKYVFKKNLNEKNVIKPLNNIKDKKITQSK